MRVWQGRRIGVELVAGPESVRKSSTFEVVRFGQGVAILPILSDGRILLIRQFRPAVCEAILEIPAGKVEEGETIDQAAARELVEETGLSGATIVPLTRIWTTPGFCDEVIHVMLATGGTLGEARPDEDERIEACLLLTGEEVRALVAGGQIRDAKTLVALFWAGQVCHERPGVPA